MAVVEATANGMSVPEAFAIFTVLSLSGLITPNVVS